MTINKRILFILFCLCNILSVFAQDFHFSQFYSSPQQLNPALTGNYIEQFRVGTIYKSQWNGLENGYNTFGGYLDTKIYQKSSNSSLAVGLCYFSDRAGRVNMALNAFSSSISYKMIISSNAYFSGGIMLGYGQRSADIQSLKWDNQYNGEYYDPSAPTGENLLAQSKGYFDAGLGLLYGNTIGKKIEYEIGGSFFHVHEPKQAYLMTDEDRLFRKYLIHTQLIWRGKHVYLVPQIYGAMQGGAIQCTAGTWIEYVIGEDSKYTNFNSSSSLSLGVFYRVNNAIIPAIKVDIKRKLQAGISYDINIARLNQLTSLPGGVELFLTYKGIFNENKIKVK